MELRGEKCKTLAGETEKVFCGAEKGMGCFFRFVQHLDFSAKTVGEEGKWKGETERPGSFPWGPRKKDLFSRLLHLLSKEQIN